MNTSKHINPVICRDCGKCCKSFSIVYPKDSEPSMLSEVDRFRLLMGGQITVEEKGDCFYVTFHHQCSKLKVELTNNGERYTCEIYDSPERPLLCQQYPYIEDILCPYKLYIPKEVKQL